MCTTCGCSDSAQVTHTDPRTGRTVVMPRLNAYRPAAPMAGLSALQPVAPAAGPAAAAPAAVASGVEPMSAAPREFSRDDNGALHAKLHGTTVALEQEILGKNQQLADRNRDWFARQGIVALNLMSSPGSGKTTLLERTLRDLRDEIPVSVVEGDQATANDAERILATGCPVIQINTGTGCHLEADMLETGLRELQPPAGSLLMIENVGNLVCPALFDLGEAARVVILSVTEGEDKPSKYPHMFRTAELMLLTKVDLLPYLRFDVQRCLEHARSVNPGIRILQLSAQGGEGLEAWYDWLRQQMAQAAARRAERAVAAAATAAALPATATPTGSAAGTALPAAAVAGS